MAATLASPHMILPLFISRQSSCTAQIPHGTHVKIYVYVPAKLATYHWIYHTPITRCAPHISALGSATTAARQAAGPSAKPRLTRLIHLVDGGTDILVVQSAIGRWGCFGLGGGKEWDVGDEQG